MARVLLCFNQISVMVDAVVLQVRWLISPKRMKDHEIVGTFPEGTDNYVKFVVSMKWSIVVISGCFTGEVQGVDE